MTLSLQPARNHDGSHRHGGSTTDPGHPDSGAVQAESDRSPDIPPEDLLALLGDEYACELMRALESGPMPARDLTDRCDMSRPTVYRRLDRLVEAGIVEPRAPAPGPSQHGREFALASDRIRFRVGDDGIEAAVGPSSVND